MEPPIPCITWRAGMNVGQTVADRDVVGGDTPAPIAASSLDRPVAISAQKCRRSSPPVARATTTCPEALDPTAVAPPSQHSFWLVLRRPIESAQYAAEPYRRALARSAITPSMSRKGDYLDNAPMESFFHSLKTGFTIGFMAPAPRLAETSSSISRASTIRAAHSALGYISPALAERMAA